MGYRISKQVWDHFRKKFPDDVKNLTCFSFTVNRSNVVLLRNSKNNFQKYGVELGTIVNWLDEVIDNQYYLEIERIAKNKLLAKIKVYFFEETDAIAFKISFGEKDLTKIQL